MKADATNYFKLCNECQLSKKLKKNYSKLLPKNITNAIAPQHCICIDTIGPQEISILEFMKTNENYMKKVRTKIITIYVLTAINKATLWLEIIQITNETGCKTSCAID